MEPSIPDAARSTEGVAAAFAEVSGEPGRARLQVLLRREGWHVNAQSVYRIYREDELDVRTAKRRKRGARLRVPLAEAVRPSQRWSMDFVSDRLADGNRFRMVVDQ